MPKHATDFHSVLQIIENHERFYGGELNGQNFNSENSPRKHNKDYMFVERKLNYREISMGN